MNWICEKTKFRVTILTMRPYFVLLSLVAALGVEFSTVWAGATNADELVKRADEFRGLQKSFSVRVRTLVQDGKEKNEQAFQVSVRDEDTSLVEQIFPERARGRKLLMKGLDMWLFTPQVKKPVRISLQQRLTGDISNGDISRTNYSKDYKAKLVGTEGDVSVLDLLAKEKRVTYHRIKYWIEKSGKPIKSEFYALNGKLLKTAEFSDFKKIDGHERMTRVTIQDAVVKSKKSILLYSHHKLETFSDGQFNKEQMDR